MLYAPMYLQVSMKHEDGGLENVCQVEKKRHIQNKCLSQCE